MSRRHGSAWNCDLCPPHQTCPLSCRLRCNRAKIINASSATQYIVSPPPASPTLYVVVISDLQRVNRRSLIILVLLNGWHRSQCPTRTVVDNAERNSGAPLTCQGCMYVRAHKSVAYFGFVANPSTATDTSHSYQRPPSALHVLLANWVPAWETTSHNDVSSRRSQTGGGSGAERKSPPCLPCYFGVTN